MKNILLRRLLDSSKKGAWLTNDLPWNDKRVLAYIIYQIWTKNINQYFFKSSFAPFSFLFFLGTLISCCGWYGFIGFWGFVHFSFFSFLLQRMGNHNWPILNFVIHFSANSNMLLGSCSNFFFHINNCACQLQNFYMVMIIF